MNDDNDTFRKLRYRPCSKWVVYDTGVYRDLRTVYYHSFCVWDGIVSSYPQVPLLVP